MGLFCLEAKGSKIGVSTLREPIGGPPVMTEGRGGVKLTLPVELVSWLCLAEMRARRELPEVLLGSLLVLDNQLHPAG